VACAIAALIFSLMLADKDSKLAITSTAKAEMALAAAQTETDTPTVTPKPTDTPPPATLVLLPTDTIVPPTDPPIVIVVTQIVTVTAAPTALPTATTLTVRPTRRPVTPTPPTPTKTPIPPFTGIIAGGFVNCTYTGVTGRVKHANDQPYAGVTVGVWSDTWEGAVSWPSDLSGKYTVDLGGNIPPGKFYVAVVEPTTCSTLDGRTTASSCKRRSNVVMVTTTANCTGSNAVQVPVVDFVGP
jgi:hypothetical protein